MKLQRVEIAFVDARKVRHLKVALHDFRLAEESGLDNVVRLELLLGADGIVAGVEFVGESVSLLLSLLLVCALVGYSRVERIDGVVKRRFLRLSRFSPGKAASFQMKYITPAYMYLSTCLFC